MTIKIISFLVILSLLGTIFTFMPIELFGLQLRNLKLLSYYDGPIQFSFLGMTTLLFAFYNIVKKNRGRILIFSISTIVWIGLAYSCTILNFGENIKQDRIIYSNQSYENDKLIFQYYETGIGGNSHWQAITTKFIDNNQIRMIHNIDMDYFQEKVNVSENNIDYEALPKVLKFKDKIYSLEKVILFHSDSIINFNSKPTNMTR